MVCILFNDVPHIFIKFCILYMYLLSDATGVNISTSLPTTPSGTIGTAAFAHKG